MYSYCTGTSTSIGKSHNIARAAVVAVFVARVRSTARVKGGNEEGQNTGENMVKPVAASDIGSAQRPGGTSEAGEGLVASSHASRCLFF